MSALIQELEAIAERVFDRKFANVSHGPREDLRVTPEALALKDRLARINVKDHISIGEAALLLSCSDGHVRNLVKKARKRQTKRPIPFTDLDGVTVFNRLALLTWANTPKHELENLRVKDRTSNGSSFSLSNTGARRKLPALPFDRDLD
jgi:hypothetical protein